jgi:predicted metalloprotease with PDZ domain
MPHTTKPARSGDSWKRLSGIASDLSGSIDAGSGRGRRIAGLAAGAFACLLLNLSAAGRADAAAEEYRAKTGAPTARVEVDAREAPRGIMSAHLTLPVSAGPLTLVYPKWLPGRHSPAGPLTSLGGPIFKANGRTLPWRRDSVDLNAFHLEIPAGTTELGVDLEIDTTIAPDGVVQGLETPRTATESLLILEWNQLVLYPAETRSDDLAYQASVRLPAGWKYAAALEQSASGPDGIGFAPVSLTTLLDSTLIAGRYFRDIPLGGTPAVTLHIAADTRVALNMSADTESHYRRLVREAAALFGSTHYDHYEFLYALTDQIMPDGLEHHQSSDDRSPLRTLLDEPTRRAEANLLPHEYVHSWNGKYRRPAGLATANYQDPMLGDMLWVYEGLTEYLGDVLAARSGLLTDEEFRGELAHDAAAMQSHTAREWRSLQETTVAASLLYYQSRNWAGRLRRQEDFYQESALLWLEADTLIRRLSKGRKSLDDFCKVFYGPPSTGPEMFPYSFDDVMNALGAVQPYDWAGFWKERLNRLRPEAPLEGIEAAGWQLSFTSTPTVMHLAHEADDKDLDLRYSLGFYVDDDQATIGDVIPRSPADAAGASPGSRIIGLNGYKWSKELLQDTLAAPADPSGTLTLLVQKDDAFKTLEVHYTGGERYPDLTRKPGTPDILSQISQPRASRN